MGATVCVLTMSGAHEAILRGLTLYGASLEGGRRLNRREFVALRLPSGRRVKARVRWRLGERCGVTFLTPVADFARLLRESRLINASPRQPRRRIALSGPRHRPENLPHRLHRAVSRAQRLSRQLLRWCRSL